MAVLTYDLSGLPKDVREKLRKTMSDRHAARLAVAKMNQARLQQAYAQAAEPGSAHKDFGPCFMAIDSYLESYFSRVCEARELVWNDPEFLKWLRKNGPEFFIREAPTKIQVGYR